MPRSPRRAEQRLRPEARPRIAVLCTLFPSPLQPGAGIFVRERMFRVARQLPLTVVAPVPWFPFQAILRRWRPGFRLPTPRYEQQDHIDVWRPRFFSIPGFAKPLDGMFLAIAAFARLRRLKRDGRLDLIDAHFGYPEGYAAVLLGRWLRVPVTITLRGNEARHAGRPALRARLVRALDGATRVFTVSESLRKVALSLGIAPERVRTIGNGVDATRFAPIDRDEARRRLGIARDAKVLISVGGLVERKGFHRVIDTLPELRKRHPALVYLVVGGPSAEGDWSSRLARQVEALGLADCVRFLGPVASDELKFKLSAADVFVLATSNEGWANVFLEAMACGLPVVTTDVGGNAEVVADAAVGTIVAYGDHAALRAAIEQALERGWDRAAIRRYAEANGWDRRVATLVDEFRSIHAAAARERGSALGSPGKVEGR
jgi:teichuronic acid biosynthesis glycosyltransferase TuaC